VVEFVDVPAAPLVEVSANNIDILYYFILEADFFTFWSLDLYVKRVWIPVANWYPYWIFVPLAYLVIDVPR
jgi:hypothetical protein